MVQAMAHGSSEVGWPKPDLLYERTSGEASAPLGENAVYRQHHPEKSVLYKVVQEHLESALQEARSRTEHGFGYPRFVEQTLRDYLACSRAELGPTII